jgi:superfamily II DNA helicase RecQ
MDFHGPKSVHQARILELVRQGQKHVLGVLPTGGGKSALFYAPSFFEGRGITVVILPLNAQIQDQLSEAKRHEVDVATWPSKMNHPGLKPGIDHVEFDVNKHRVVIVSAHDAGSDNCFTWLCNLRDNKGLGLIVIDEADEVLHGQDYRRCMPYLKRLTELGSQILFLTATMSKLTEKALFDFFCIPRHLAATVRAPTWRPEISYRFTHLRDLDAMKARVQEIIRTTDLKPHERGLIFCNTYDDCDMLSELLHIPKYNGKQSRIDNSTTFEEWKTGSSQWAVATAALGKGVNYQHVRYVVHFKPAENATRYYQESGRGGRDGKPAIAETLYTSSDIPSGSHAKLPDYCGQIPMRRLLTCDDECLRLGPSLFFDQSAITCFTLQHSQFCGNCAVRTPSPDLIEPIPF